MELKARLGDLVLRLHDDAAPSKAPVLGVTLQGGYHRKNVGSDRKTVGCVILLGLRGAIKLGCVILLGISVRNQPRTRDRQLV